MLYCSLVEIVVDLISMWFYAQVMNGSSNLFQKFRRRAGKSKLFSSFRGRNGNKTTSTLECLNENSPVESMLNGESTNSRNPSSSHREEKVAERINLTSSTPTNHTNDINMNRHSYRDRDNLTSSLIGDVTVTADSLNMDDDCNSSSYDNPIITPPTPFRVLVTPSDNESGATGGQDSTKRIISSDLRREIETSLLHWPSDINPRDYSVCSLHRPTRGSRTLPKHTSAPQGLHLPNRMRRSGRPLSWSYDMSDNGTRAVPHPPPASQSNYSLGQTDAQARLSDRTPSVSSYDPTPTSSYTSISGSDNAIMDADDSYDTLASDEFGDAVTALRSFDSQRRSYNRDSRRMSQPHPIKSRSRLPSQDSVQSLVLPPVSRQRRARSKSEPARLVHDEIRQNFHKELSTALMLGLTVEICPIVGDIASLKSESQHQFSQPALTIADPLWHHVTNEPEELSFHVGDVIMVLDMSDKDWWWGRKASSANLWLPPDTREQEEAGWFPSTFVRLRANQSVTTDELLEDIKHGTADTATVVQHYSSALLSRDQARRNVVNEIITAERDYVKHLKDITEGFIAKALERTDMFTERQIALIFGNISELYSISKSFLASLETAVTQYDSVHLALVGKCFLEHKSKFEIYSAYCNNHPRALEELQALNKESRYSHFFEACRMLQNMIELPLDGFLLYPIQKICKYPLQLGELLKYTSATHEDYHSLQEALVAMKNIAMLINERKRKLESIQKILEWQRTVYDWQDEDLLVASSELIHSGELSKLSSAGRLVDRHFFLFDHQLIQCKKELLKKSLIFKSRISLDHHSIVSIEDGKVNNSSTYAKNAFEVRDQDGVCILFLSAKSVFDKKKWMECFTREREIVQQDKDNGFAVTDSLKTLAQLSTPTKTSKPNKSSSLAHRFSDSKLTTPNIMDSKDKTNNNNTLGKQKSGNGIIHKLKRSRIPT